MTKNLTKNLFDSIPKQLSDELFETLQSGASFRLERIVSAGHHTPQGEWLEQNEDEWVILLVGSALLRFENRPQPTALLAGDYLHIPANNKHRVEATSGTEKTVWLALHFTP